MEVMHSVRQIGRYRIVQELGRGSVGVVYKAFDTSIERDVALKVVQRPRAESPPLERETYERFLRESRLAGRLQHPAVVTIYDVGEDAEQGLSYIAMEFVDGESLDRLLARRERLSADRIRTLGVDVAEALELAHAEGIVHRDIKPANLLLTRSGAVKVTDFGIARSLDAQMTLDGTLLGSPQYMSPEQVQSARVDFRSDLFSLGSVLYELATLKPAFSGENTLEVLKAVAEQEPEPPRRLSPELPQDLEVAILKALMKDRDSRFQTAAEMRHALEGPPASEPTPELDPSRWAETLRSGAPAADAEKGVARWRYRLPAALLGGALVVALGLWGLSPAWFAASSPSGGAEEMPLAVPQGEAAMDPRPTPSLTPARPPTGLSLLMEIPVEHRHRFGSCRGRLLVFQDRLEYDSTDRDKDDVSWSYAEVVSFRFDPPAGLRFNVHQRDKGRRNYHFKAESAQGLEALVAHVQAQTAR